MKVTLDESMPSTLLLLVRHAEQTTLREFDPSLSARGERQAERLADRLCSLPVTSIFTSPLLRARQTAAPLAAALGLTPTTDRDLEEVRLSTDEMSYKFTHTSAGGMEPDVNDYIGPTMTAIRVVPRFVWGRNKTGESGVDIRARVTPAVERIVASVGHGIVVCVSHGGTINSALGDWIGVERDMWFVPWHTGITAILFRGDSRTLLFVNDASHLTQHEDILSVVATSLKVIEA